MAEWGFSVGSYMVNIVDVVIIIIGLLAAVAGVARGFAMKFTSRAGFLIGLVVALLFARLGASLLVETFESPLLWSTLIAFILLFVLGYILIMIVGSLLDRTLEALGLDWLDRLLGSILGIVEALIMIAFIIYLFELQKVVDVSLYLDRSVITTKFIKPLTPVGLAWIKGLV